MKLTRDQMRRVRLNQPRLTSEEIVDQARRNWKDLIERGLAPASDHNSSNGLAPSESSPNFATDGEMISIACCDLPAT